MKNKQWILFILIGIILIGFGIYFFINNNNNNSKTEEYQTSKLSSENDIDINNNENNTSTNNIAEQPKTDIVQPPQEIEIGSFSTKIYTTDSSRQNNINITCSTLNDTIVENGATFSFCNTVGQSTTAKGYQKADIFDKNGNKKKGLGGGNCQVSTTLYNAVLNTPNLTVTERHEHSNHVPYIEEGKDAAVAYGSYDLKFVNNTGNAIKIKASTDSASVSISILKII